MTRAYSTELRDATRHEQIFAGRADDPYTLAVRAYVWGYPLVQMARIRLYGTQPDDPFGPRPASSTGAPLNRWGHQTVPADPDFRAGVGPSVDLLYSSLRLDLDGGPYVVEVPHCGSRYYTVQIVFADSSAEQSYGRRTHGPELPPILLYGPNGTQAAPAGMLAVYIPTRYCLLPTRFLFDPGDPADLAAVRQLQAQLRVRTLDAFRVGRDEDPPVPDQRRLPRGDQPLTFLAALGVVLQDWVVRIDERQLVDQFVRIGLSPQRGFDPTAFTERELRDIERGLADGAEIVRRKSLQLGTEHNGWTTNYLGPRFRGDWLLRAGVARDQIVVTVPEEALYPLCRVDVEGRPLHGTHRYKLRFASDEMPPADAFWSVTLYGDNGFLVTNELGRYSVSDRTPGLRRLPDGSVDIAISGHRPTDPAANWLPAPAGRFYLMLRLYLPRPAALDASWRPPGVRRLGA